MDTSGPQGMTAQPPSEPDFATACGWWPDLDYIWTPIGWKNHLLRFNVFWNGTILAAPDLNRRCEHWRGQGVQLSFVATPLRPFESLRPIEQMAAYVTQDDGMVRQGWQTAAAPVLWSEYATNGISLRQEVFAHIPGGKDVRRGDEPLFAWIRLSLADVCEGMAVPEKMGFLVTIDAPHVIPTMTKRRNVLWSPEKARYPRELAAQGLEALRQQAGYLVEPDGRVRLAVPAGQDAAITFCPGTDKVNRYLLHVQTGPRVGHHVDLLVPMLPTDRATVDGELALGFEGALRQANRYWSRKPSTAARFSVPEDSLNQAVEHSLRFAEVIAERNPADGQYSMVSGSFAYTDLWPTPHSMASIMLLDTLGYHQQVERYLEIFRKEQGTVKPPGKAYELHPGYLSSPKTLTSIDWLPDHGALLYTICAHAMLTGDQRFLKRWIGTIVKACEFIRDACAIRGHGGVEGLPPAAVFGDWGGEAQAVWASGWFYKGLTAAVRLLERMDHPRAEEFRRLAVSYRRTFVRALRKATAAMPTWTDARGRTHHLVPTHLDRLHADPSVAYLDAGPLQLVYAGLLDADDPLMRSTLLWFREGPPRRFYRFDGPWSQLPSLHHEMGSAEPCYSWNLFHAWQSGDRPHFLEGMYSLFAGSLSRQTFISCETRGGMTGTIFSSPLAVYAARLAVIDDQLDSDELHLLRLMPLAWLRPGQGCDFEAMPTTFGPVTLRTRMGRDGKTLKVTWRPQFRTPPGRVVLHPPPIAGLRLLINGRAADSEAGEVVLA